MSPYASTLPDRLPAGEGHYCSAGCRTAQSPRRKCRCSCNGAEHGTERQTDPMPDEVIRWWSA